MIVNFSAIRNPSTELPGTHVEVSATRCQSVGISQAYAGLQGTIIAAENGECLVHLDEASQACHEAIEATAFSAPFRDLDEDQWFCSGVLEVVQTKESEKIMQGEIITTKEALELLDILIRLMKEEDGADEEWQQLDKIWPQEKVIRCTEVIRDIVAESGVFIGSAEILTDITEVKCLHCYAMIESGKFREHACVAQ
jgi:hypothetical protein